MQKIAIVFHLIKKEVKTDFRKSSVFSGLFLYSAILCFLLFLNFRNPSESTWNSLYLVVLVFSGLQIGAKGFQSDSTSHNRWLQTMVDAEHLWIAKWLYSTILMILIGGMSLILFIILLGLPDGLTEYWLLAWFLGILALSVVFALMASVAQVAGGGLALTAVLALPVAIPAFTLISNSLRKAALLLPFDMLIKDFSLLAILSVGLILLGYILFPFIWKTE